MHNDLLLPAVIYTVRIWGYTVHTYLGIYSTYLGIYSTYVSGNIQDVSGDIQYVSGDIQYVSGDIQYIRIWGYTVHIWGYTVHIWGYVYVRMCSSVSKTHVQSNLGSKARQRSTCLLSVLFSTLYMGQGKSKDPKVCTIPGTYLLSLTV
jgi:hypothetical protein